MDLYKEVNGKRVKCSVEERDSRTAEWEANRVVEESTKYQSDRACCYPNILDQLDMLYHDMEAGNMPVSPTWFAAIKAVKDQHPKPE